MRRHTTLVVAAGLVPLFALVLLFACLQFASQRTALLREIEDDLVEHNLMLSSVIKDARDHVSALAFWSDRYLEDDSNKWMTSEWPAADASLLIRRSDPPPAGEPMGIASKLVPHMRIAHQEMPYLRLSFYLSGAGDLAVLYPAPEEALDDIGSRDAGVLIFDHLVDRLEPSGSNGAAPSEPGCRWNGPERDPGGGGWVVLCSRAVQDSADGSPAVVGTGLLLDFLIGFVRAFDYPAGELWLVDGEQGLLAAAGGSTVEGLDRLQLADVLPVELASLPAAQLLTPTTGIEARGGAYHFAQALDAAPWTLLYVVEEAELIRVLLPRFVPYGVILVAIVLAVVLAQQVRQHLVLRPAMRLVDFIRAESLELRPRKPAVPAPWKPWVDAVATAFDARRALLDQTEDRARHFHAIAESHPIPVCITGLEDRRIRHASAAFARLYRIPHAQLAGMDTAAFYVDLGDRDRLLDSIRRGEGAARQEFSARRADGTVFPASMTSRLIDFGDAPALVSAVFDLTEHRAAQDEIARQRDALHQSEKLNALGSMLANVAHELNNPLSVVVGYATMMRDLAPDAATRDRAERVHDAAERCARVVRTFLAMARRKPAVPEPVDLNQVAEAALDIVGYGLKTADVLVVRDFGRNLAPVVGDADQLTLVLMNLIVNAQHALQMVSPPRRLWLTTAASGAELRLDLEDNGPGVPPELRERIFEPFFTTKPQGVGTGIGLSVCRNVLEAHGGSITVAGREHGGTQFTVRLPAAPAAETESWRSPRAAAMVRGRILVVDDELDIAEMLAELLGRDGHEVRYVENGRAALEELECEPVDLILSDIRMPDMDGWTLHRVLEERSPALAARMVFLTGDALAPETAAFVSRKAVTVLEKPIDPTEIRRQVGLWLSRGNRTPTEPVKLLQSQS